MDALTRLLEELTKGERAQIAALAAVVLQDIDGDELRELATALAGTPAGERFLAAVMEAYNEGR